MLRRVEVNDSTRWFARWFHLLWFEPCHVNQDLDLRIESIDASIISFL